MKKLTEKITQFIENFKNVHAEARKIGFAGIMRLLWKDLFVGRSLSSGYTSSPCQVFP